MKSFASSTRLLLETLPEPDELLGSDTLLSITINHNWRELFIGALENYLRQDNSEISLDNQDLLSRIFEELYNP